MAQQSPETVWFDLGAIGVMLQRVVNRLDGNDDYRYAHRGDQGLIADVLRCDADREYQAHLAGKGEYMHPEYIHS